MCFYATTTYCPAPQPPLLLATHYQDFSLSSVPPPPPQKNNLAKYFLLFVCFFVFICSRDIFRRESGIACQSQTRLMSRPVKHVPVNTEEVKTNRRVIQPEFKCWHTCVSANAGHLRIFAFHICRISIFSYNVTSVSAAQELRWRHGCSVRCGKNTLFEVPLQHQAQTRKFVPDVFNETSGQFSE